MSKSGLLRIRDLLDIRDVAEESRELGDHVEGLQSHFFPSLARLVGAEVSFGGELAGLPGRPRKLGTPVDSGLDFGFDRKGWDRALELLETDPKYSSSLTQYFQRSSSAPGSALRRSDLLTNANWQRSREFGECFVVTGVDHHLTCFQTIPGTTGEAIGGIW